ncbi:MAG: hypothetical protein R2822_07835 [Spirosomataceae bacterium]
MRFSLFWEQDPASPVLGRFPSSQLLLTKIDDFSDCGEGYSFHLLEQKFRPSKLKGIFISHLHGDHYFGTTHLGCFLLNLGERTDPLFAIWTAKPD